MTEKEKWRGELIAKTPNSREIRVFCGESEHTFKFQFKQWSLFPKSELLVDGEVVKLSKFLLRTKFTVQDKGASYRAYVFFNRKWNFQVGHLMIVIDKQLVYMERNR